MPITTASFAKGLEPGVQQWYDTAAKSREPQYTQIFETRTSKRAYEELMSTSWFGMPAVVPEGGAVPYDTAQQGFYTRFNHFDYKLGFIITKNAISDNQYMELAQARTRALARSFYVCRETVAANILNRADTAGFVGGDGVVLSSASHPNKAGGTYSNQPTVAASLSEAALEQAEIDVGAWTDDRGLLMAVNLRKLVVPRNLKFEAERILMSSQRVATADNDLNALATTSTIPGGYTVNHYLTDANMWYVLTDHDEAGLIHYLREDEDIQADNDFDTSNAKFKKERRESFGWGSPKSIYVSNPA